MNDKEPTTSPIPIPNLIPASVVRKIQEALLLAFDALSGKTKDLHHFEIKEVLRGAFSGVKNHTDFPFYHKKLFDDLSKNFLDEWDALESPKNNK